MSQQRYVISAILILLVGFTIFFLIRKISSVKHEENPSSKNIIDYVDSDKDLDTIITEGKRLYQENCISCHNIFRDIEGPSLATVRERWPDSMKLYEYIRNPDKFNNDKYIISLRDKFGVRHLGFPALTNKEIRSIIIFIEGESNKKELPTP